MISINDIFINIHNIFIWIGNPNPCLRVAVGRPQAGFFVLDMPFWKEACFVQKLAIFVNVCSIFDNF